MSWDIYSNGLYIILTLAFGTWLLSVYMRDVSIVDSAWSIMFLVSAGYYYSLIPETDMRTNIIFTLIALWALRLSLHLTWRNWGEPEDIRYQEIRTKYSPNFAFKSLYIIFLFQAILAWLISAPLLSALHTTDSVSSLSAIDIIAMFFWVIGFTFESVSDYQLSKFKSNPDNSGKVMDKGLWKFSRHPNYFGEFMIWWGFYLFAMPYAPAWIIISPILMSWLLLKFSGVVMLEESIVIRKPQYKNYIQYTNTFFPGPRKIKQENI